MLAGMMPLLGITMGEGAGKPAWKGSRGSVGKQGGSVGVELLIAVIRAHRVVVCVGIILKWRVADAEASPNYRLFRTR